MGLSFSRLRLMVTDNPEASPDRTRVLVRQRTAWVVLACAFLALACLPAHRALMLDQTTRALGRRLPGWIPSPYGAPEASTEPLMATVRRFPQDRNLHLGSVLISATPEQSPPAPVAAEAGSVLGDPGVRASEAVRARFPDDPAAIALVLRNASAVSLQVSPEPGASATGMAPLSASDGERLAELCRQGAALDPSNGYFPSMLAAIHFAAGETEAALSALHDASVCASWDDYALQEVAGARELLVRTYGDRGLLTHALPAATLRLPHVQSLRHTADLVMEAAKEARRQGDVEREHRLRTDLIRLGALIRRDSDTLIGRLVGAAVVDLGFGALLEPGQRSENSDASRQEQADLRRDYARRVEKEAPSLASEVAREMRLSAEFEDRKRQYFGNAMPFLSWDHLLGRETRRDVAGLTLLSNLAAGLVCWLLAAVVLSLRRPNAGGSAAALRPWSAAGLAVVLLVTGASLALAARSGDLSASWVGLLPALRLAGGEAATAGRGAAAAHWLSTGLLLPAGIVISTVVLAVLGRRNRWEAVDGMRLAFKTGAALLATAYLGYVLYAVPASARDARAWDRQMTLEARAQPI